MKRRMQELTGCVKMMNSPKSFGFIAVEGGDDIYFQYRDLDDAKLIVGDEVLFIVNVKGSRKYASAIRKVYNNSKEVKFVNRVNSHLHNNIQKLLPEVVEKVSDFSDDFDVQEIEFDRVVGKTICVPASEGDDVVYAIRKGRNGHTRFVKDRESIDCKIVTIVLKKMSEGTVLIVSCFIGKKAEVEPFDERATKSSIEFWSSHALIWDGEEIIEGSKVIENPWELGCNAISLFKNRRRVA